MQPPSISAIVPIYNEEKTVAGVVTVLLHNPAFIEVICVNDGSTDRSLDVLAGFKDEITLIDLPENRGKGYALVAGIQAAQGELVAFFDGDLTNLSPAHIQTLLAPVLKGEADAVLGYPKKGSMPNVFSHLTGERIYYKRDLHPFLEQMAQSRFGVEVLLNDLFAEKRVQKIPLENLIGLLKHEKHTPLNAFKEYLGEGVEIAQTLSLREILAPEDSKIIAGLSRITNFREFESAIKKITDQTLRNFLENYILNYLKMAHQRLKDEGQAFF